MDASSGSERDTVVLLFILYNFIQMVWEINNLLPSLMVNVYSWNYSFIIIIIAILFFLYTTHFFLHYYTIFSLSLSRYYCKVSNGRRSVDVYQDKRHCWRWKIKIWQGRCRCLLAINFTFLLLIITLLQQQPQQKQKEMPFNQMTSRAHGWWKWICVTICRVITFCYYYTFFFFTFSLFYLCRKVIIIIELFIKLMLLLFNNIFFIFIIIIGRDYR